MKSSQLNTSENPTTAASSPRDNPCLGSDATIAALDVFADDGTSYLLPYAQFLYAEKISNPALESWPRHGLLRELDTDMAGGCSLLLSWFDFMAVPFGGFD